MVVLVDRVRQLTGEQLNTAQVKAIRSNSQMPTSTKILIGVGVGAAVGLAIFGIYKVTTRLPFQPSPQFPLVPIHPFVLFQLFSSYL